MLRKALVVFVVAVISGCGQEVVTPRIAAQDPSTTGTTADGLPTMMVPPPIRMDPAIVEVITRPVVTSPAGYKGKPVMAAPDAPMMDPSQNPSR